MKHWLFLSVIYLIAVCTTIYAQPASFSPTTLLSQGSVYQWSGENGLISNNITSAIQSSEGFIWITTYNGIMRFDGKRILVYDRSTLPFLETDAFYRVYEDTKGTLWFASQGSGITIYRNKKFFQVEAANAKIPKSVRSLLIEDDGTVLIGSNNEGLYRLSPALHLEKISTTQLDAISILDMAKDATGKLWIATDGNGLISYDGTKFIDYTEKEGLLSNTINTVAVSRTNEVFIGTTDGLNVLRNGKVETEAFLKNVPINDLSIDEINRKWIATENGLARISNDGTLPEFVNRRNGFPFSRLNALARDAEGSLWISTGRDGLLQVRETGIMNIGEKQNISNKRVNIIVEGNKKQFYIGTDVGTIDVYEKGELRPLQLNTDLGEAGIRDICEDEKGVLWIASYKGILRKQGATETLFTEKEGLPSIDMRRILRDAQNNLWFASRSGGLLKYVPSLKKVTDVYSKGNGLESNYVLSLEQDRAGNIYVGTHSGGLTIIKPDGSSMTHHLTTDDSGVLIFNIHIDNENKVWLISNIGPYLFNGSQFKKINLVAVNKGETYFDWLEDVNRDVWITTNLGVLKIVRKDLDDFLAGASEQVPVKLFDHQDGMQSKECTGATRSLISLTGRLWIPTIAGVSVFYPDQIVENKVAPKVYVTDLATDSGFFEEDTVVVTPGNLRYVFNYTALSYLAPSKIKFRYKLDKVDQDWVEAGSKREAEYTNLSPGTYVFRALACNSDGVWNTVGASKVVIVKPFFYQTAWFYLVSICLIILALYVLYRWRIYVVERRNTELKKLNSELDRFVYSASHDLRAPLSSILGLIAVARMDPHKNVDEYLTLIEKSIHKLDGFIRDIIDFSRNSRTDLITEPISFQTMIEEIIEELKYMDERGDIEKVIEVKGTAIFYSDRKRLAIVLRNLISNAYKYHRQHVNNRFLKVDVVYDETRATIKVVDNGIGIMSEHLPFIFNMFYRGTETNKGSGLGLYIVKETVEKIKGSISVESKVDKGTTFELIIPSLKGSS